MKQKNAAFGVKRSLWLAVALIPMAAATTLSADVMTISGVINQSVADGTGPAANNPGLNDIRGWRCLHREVEPAKPHHRSWKL